MRILSAIIPLSLGAFSIAGVAAEITPDQLAFFEERIRPALVKYCYECHSEVEGKSKGGLRVDTRRMLEQGGDTGPAVVPGDLEASLLITSIHYDDPDFEMPPDGKLPDDVIRDFERWVEMGAPDPREDSTPVESGPSEIDIEAGRDFWSFRAPVLSEAPEIDGGYWARSDIDRFVLSGMRENGLAPAKDARPEVLVRRLYFLLCGLPPSPEDVYRWARAIGPDLKQAAVAELVDELLSSPRFGERWGQHWLDVARYADSTGGDSNNIYPDAWRYRDYVIASFNEDKPFDRFILEQLAGDLIPPDSDEEWAWNLVGTGFLAVGQKLVGEQDDLKFRADLIDEQIDATTRAFLGITAACARCHDHKTDPIPQSDYYALANFFQNTETYYGLLDAQARQSSELINVTGLGLPPGREVLTAEEFAALKQERDQAAAEMDAVRGMIRSDDEDLSRAKLRRTRTQVDRTAAALNLYDEEGRPLSFVMGVQDCDDLEEVRLLVRGELNKPAEIVPPGFLQVVGRELETDFEGSGRLELAHWIADSSNPLTARVMANRVWHWLFGQGLVRTVDDFGATGELPSHPELLDYLAIRLVEHDWSIKQLIREMVMSRSFQQGAQFDAANFEIDPDNCYLWRFQPRRLEAEAIRDAMLTVSGRLETGPPPVPLLDVVGEGTVGQNVYEPEIRAIRTNARSVYLPRVRNVLPDVLALFDAPDGSNVSGARETTTVPLQALFALNEGFAQEHAAGFARQLAGKPVGERIDFAYLKAFGRFPTDRERQLARSFTQQFRGADGDEAVDSMEAYCHALMCTAEFGMIE